MRRVILAVASTLAGLILLLSFKTHSTTALTTPPTVVSAPSTTTTTTAAAASRRSTSSSSGGTTPATTKTVAGDVSATRYGPVQVQVTVKNGKVTAVTATQYPSGDSRSQQINAYAIPVLNQEALQAKSANVHMISGATYTSDGYIASLQSALIKAGLA
ncbi:MAG: hypothetical protein QOD85_151 [Gaiellaceae bacterium]|nr:hypothetical protein [Gaiellaceae bacterium]